MNQKLTIPSDTAVNDKNGVSTRTGKPFSIREQTAYLHTGALYPVKCVLTLGRDQPPYVPGEYEIESPLSVGRFDSLQVNRDLGLKLIKAAQAKAA